MSRADQFHVADSEADGEIGPVTLEFQEIIHGASGIGTGTAHGQDE